MEGYNDQFLGKKFAIGIPNYDKYLDDVAINKETSNPILNYINYSVIQSKSRRVPLLSASNIYRIKFEKAGRSGSFKLDKRIGKKEQLTSNDYKQFNTIKAAAIEKGHMTKREDVQWDINGVKEVAKNAAISTFYYPNATPQHDSLNNGPWKYLENSIIIKGRLPQPARVTVFTGPVLDILDPEFKAKLHDGSTFKIPVLFWKVIYYLKDDGKLYKAGFLMGQINPLRRDHLINEIRIRDAKAEKKKSSLKPFLDFKEDENYQVPVSLIEKLTKMKFRKAIDRHAKIKPTALKLKKIQIKGSGQSKLNEILPFDVNGLLI